MLVAALERAQTEVIAGRRLVDALEAQIKSKQKLLDEMIRRDETRVEIEKSLQAEIVSLKAAVAAQTAALKIKDEEIDFLKKELKATQKKLKSTQRREKWLVIGLGIFIAGKFLF